MNPVTHLAFKAPTKDDIPNVLANIADTIRRLTASQPWSPTTGFKVNLILEELATNTISHGSPPDNGQPDLSISITPTPQGADIQYQDSGFPFDPLTDAPKTPAPTAEPLHMPLNGQGITLVRHMAHSITYRRLTGINSLSISVTH